MSRDGQPLRIPQFSEYSLKYGCASVELLRTRSFRLPGNSSNYALQFKKEAGARYCKKCNKVVH